jgi:hypothetical protein
MKKNVENRRLGALERLKVSKFSPKVLENGKNRTKKDWEKRKENEVKTLKDRVRVS